MDILEAVNFSLHFALAASVLGIIGVVLVAGLYEVVQNKVQGPQHRDEIAAKTRTVTSIR